MRPGGIVPAGLIAITVLAAGPALLLPASSDAATASVSGDVVIFTAGSGEANRLSVLDTGAGRVRFQDSGAPVFPGSPGCEQQFSGAVDCAPSAPGARVIVALRDGSDQLVVSSRSVTVSAGSGHDAIVGGPGNDVLKGGGGSDTLEGRGGDDELFGGAQGDRLLGGRGSDALSGGRGNDQLSGGRDRDRLAGGSGVDQANAGRDGAADRVYCGSGVDFAFLYRRDRARGCELIKRF